MDILSLCQDIQEFALKGGTAINFFIRNMPRLSVDIDLTYLPLESREISLDNIHNNLQAFQSKIIKLFPNIKISKRMSQDSKHCFGLVISRNNVAIKCEVNLIIRGSVYPPELKMLHPDVQKIFGKAVEIQTLSFADLYAGKICAALDRQHPRDLFDIMLLNSHEGITDDIRKAFIVYLISHNRPISELLKPNKVPIRQIYDNEFKGMTNMNISLNDLLETRDRLFDEIVTILTENEKQFLLSFKSGKPQWKLLEFNHIQYLPAVQWKLQNINKMSPKKHNEALEKLASILV